jgi:threonine/homoserine/homoserine lactone efflux protein
LGVLYATLALITDTAYGVFAGVIRKLVINNRRLQTWIGHVGGGLLIGLGLKAAFARAN